ncbi:hypothetical protein C0058_02765 [Pseudomonas sp. NC02]|nr:hypothetical protein C0058_02765 [Pseudomonas sp. NC02]
MSVNECLSDPPLSRASPLPHLTVFTIRKSGLLGLIGVWQWHYAKHACGNNSLLAGRIVPRSRAR